MVDHIFFKGIAGVVHVIDTDVYIRRIDFAAALIYGHKHRFDSGCGACHEACSPRRGYCKACDISASIFHHVLI